MFITWLGRKNLSFSWQWMLTVWLFTKFRIVLPWESNVNKIPRHLFSNCTTLTIGKSLTILRTLFRIKVCLIIKWFPSFLALLQNACSFIFMKYVLEVCLPWLVKLRYCCSINPSWCYSSFLSLILLLVFLAVLFDWYRHCCWHIFFDKSFANNNLPKPRY